MSDMLALVVSFARLELTSELSSTETYDKLKKDIGHSLSPSGRVEC